MSTAAKTPPITVEQYQGFEGYPGLRDELIYGEIVLSPQAKPLHQQVAKNIERLLDRAVNDSPFTAQRDSNIKFFESNSMPAPDVFVVTRDEWKRACETDVYLDTPPVLVVEILSPANRKRRVDQKVELYLRAGVLCVWIVDPKRNKFTVHTSGNAAEELSATGTVILPTPLMGEIDLANVFQLDQPSL